MNLVVEKYYAEHDSIMEEWRNKHESQGYSDFIYDGVINPELWFAPNNKGERILFILKEGINKEKPSYATSLVEELRDPERRKLNKTCKPLCLWYCGLNNTTKEKIPCFEDYAKQEDLLSFIEKCAVINVKKSNGVYPSVEKDLKGYISADYDLLKRQIACINPSMIVCGYTFHLLKDYNGRRKKIDYNIFPGDTSIKNDAIGCYDVNGLPVISYFHPSNRYPESLNFYGLVGMYHDFLNSGERHDK